MIPSNYFPLEFFRHKVRVRLLDAATGHPLTGVAVTLTAEVSDGEPKLSVPLNTLVTDHVGYVAFSLARFGSFTPEIETLNPRAAGFDTDRVSALRLDAPAVGLRGHDLLASLFSGNMALGGPGPLADLTVIGSQWAANRVAQLGLNPADRPLVNHFDSAFVVKASRSAALADCECHTRVKGLRSVEEADDIDRLVSPGSFFAQDPVLVGEGGCQVATAAATPPRDVRLFQVVVDAPANPDLAGANRPLSMTDKGAAPQGPRWATAQRFLQRWTPLGYSLGDIRYSLPLAPGESVNLAVIEWSREDRITRRDAAFSQEGLQHRQKRNRDIEEAVTAMLSEDQGGGSFMAGLSGAANATVPVSGVPVNLAAGTAIGGGVTHSWGQRDISADTAQNLRDKLSQTSESLRSLNSTTVIVANQSERNELSTRTVANHNRCHALTIQYFEVLRNYRVELFRLPDLRALLVPFTPISFDAQAALRWEHLLRPALLNTALAEGFDALRLRLYGAALLDKPGGSGAGSGGGTGGGAGGTAGGTGAGGANQGPTPFTGSSKRSLSPVKNLESSNFDNTNLYIAANSLVQVKEDADSGWVSYGPTIDYGAGGSTPVPAAEAALWKDAGSPKYSLVAKIGNRTYPVGASRTFTAMDSGMLEFFVNDQIGSYNDNWAIRRNGEIFPAGTIYGLRYTVTVMAPNQPTAPVVPEVPLPTLLQDTDPSPRAVADYRAEALLAHLASQSVHYNRVVWMSMDRADLELLLDAADTGRKQLFDGVDARPVAIWRNHLAFIAPGSGIAEEGRSSRPLSSQIVALPSRGVLAEAQLGSCVACEERDASRVQECRRPCAEAGPAGAWSQRHGTAARPGADRHSGAQHPGRARGPRPRWHGRSARGHRQGRRVPQHVGPGRRERPAGEAGRRQLCLAARRAGGGEEGQGEEGSRREVRGGRCRAGSQRTRVQRGVGFRAGRPVQPAAADQELRSRPGPVGGGDAPVRRRHLARQPSHQRHGSARFPWRCQQPHPCRCRRGADRDTRDRRLGPSGGSRHSVHRHGRRAGSARPAEHEHAAVGQQRLWAQRPASTDQGPESWPARPARADHGGRLPADEQRGA